MKRREFIAGMGATAARPLESVATFTFGARAQESIKIARIGYLSPGSPLNQAPYLEALRAGLRDLGYVEGHNVVIEYRYAGGNNDRLSEMAAELVRLDVDVLITHAASGVIAAKQATTTIPIVMTSSAEVTRLGMVASINRPGGNVTGQTYFHAELNVKRLELLKEILPSSRRIGVILNPDNQVRGPLLEAMELGAESMNLELQPCDVRTLDEYASAFSAMVTKRVDAIVAVDDPITVLNAGLIVELATAQRLPSIGFLELARAGGLMAYGVDFVEMWRHTAVFVDKILKGAKPGGIPIEQPTKYLLVVNLKTAKMLAITMPHPVLARADEVIE